MKRKKTVTLLIILSLSLFLLGRSRDKQAEAKETSSMSEKSATQQALATPIWNKPASDYQWVEMWIKDSSLSIPRASPAVVAANGFIYAMGGGNFGKDHIFYSFVEYAKIKPDGSLGPWKRTSPMNTKRMFAAAVAANGYIYVIGGEKGVNEPDDLLSTVERARILPDGSLGEWVIEKNKMGTNRRALVASYYNGWIYAFGGYNGIFLKDLERSRVSPDGSLGEWIHGTEEAKSERYIHSGLIFKDHVYLFGGHARTMEKASDTVERTKIFLDGKLGSWNEMPPMPTNRFGAGAVALQNNIYLIGGQNSIMLTAVDRAKIGEGGQIEKWSYDTLLPSSRIGAGLAVWNDVIYVIGGAQGEKYLNEVLRAYYSPGEKLGAWVNDPEIITKADHYKNRPPVDALNHIHRAWEKHLEKKYNEAEVELYQAIKIKSNYAQAHNLLALVYRKKKMYTEAIYKYKETIELDPEYTQAYFGLANLYYELTFYQDAEKMYRKTVALKPEFVSAKVKLFRLLLELNKCEKAKLVLELILEEDLKKELSEMMNEHCKK